MEWIRWSRWGSSGRIEGGQMRWRDIQLNLQKFEQEAKRLMVETGADHVVYGMKIYEDGHLKEARFYLQPMNEAEFDRVASLSGVIVYALHKKEGLAVMCYSSQAQGYFSCADKEDFMENPVYDNPREFYENEISRLRLKKVKVLAKKYQCDPTQIALKYMLCKDAFPTIPIIGSGRLSEVKLSIEAMGIPLTKEECEYLENDAKE